MKITDLFDLNHTILKDYLLNYTYPWEILKDLNNIILKIGKTLPKEEYKEISPNIWIHNTVELYPTTCIIPPVIIGENTEIRHSSFLRGNVIIGSNSVIGNSVEIKNSIIFDNVQIPHFNYVGDSILGYKTHLGAGVIISNQRLDKKEIIINNINTNLKKLGALIGDNSEIGCNSVINPGTILNKNTKILPLSSISNKINF